MGPGPGLPAGIMKVKTAPVSLRSFSISTVVGTEQLPSLELDRVSAGTNGKALEVPGIPSRKSFPSLLFQPAG